MQQANGISRAPVLVSKVSNVPASTRASQGTCPVGSNTTSQGMVENFCVEVGIQMSLRSTTFHDDMVLDRIDTFESAPQHFITTDGSRRFTISRGRLWTLTAGLRRQAPSWANRLSSAKTDDELLKIVCQLFNLSIALTHSRSSSLNRKDLSKDIDEFVGRNLHKGLTLKVLAQFLGYSEKYCSDLFHSTMGESFSGYLKRRRTAAAATLLTTTEKSIVEIAAALGFSDQFAFSHFFKRATGRSPRDFRVAHARRPLLRNKLPALREAL